jgi:hypothetical protein
MHRLKVPMRRHAARPVQDRKAATRHSGVATATVGAAAATVAVTAPKGGKVVVRRLK